MKILIAEDDMTSRLVLGATLKKLGHEVTATSDGRQAWDALHKEHFPLLISDWMMPDMDGLELCRLIRAEHHSQYTYIVLLTALGGKASYLDGMDAGADDFITKPFDEDQLVARLRVADRILALHEKLRTQAMFDGLTGLFNRAAITGCLDSEMDRAAVFVGTDITERKQTEAALQKLHDELEKRVEERTEELADVVAALRDEITERKQTEEALRQSEARKGAILETALDCIITIDHEGVVLEWNPASERTFGYSREEATGRLLGELIVPEPLREQHYQGIARYLATGEGSLLGNRIEVPALRADGTEIVVELAITSIATDGPPLFTAYVRDVTARKQTDEALQAAKSEAERANRAKSEFLSRMSHELRTPLNAILGFGQLLEMDDLNDEQRQGVEQILKGGRHLLELVNEVLDIASIESEQQPLDIEPVPVALTLAGALEMIQPLASTRGIELGGDWDAAVGIFVLADQRRLKQVLLNLLANAVKYNREGGTATLSCTATEAGRLRIAISDTGMGVAPEKIGQLFTPFERLGADDSGIEGTGLGLALSKRLVEAMGGEIGVTSTWGEGSTFWIELPLAQEQASSVQPAQDNRDTAAPQATRAGETQAVVLYIEDNLANFGLVQTILRHRPEIKLLAAMQGRQGIELAQRHRPDLILLDFHLPDINGDEVLRRLREDPETRDIPVLIVSADATPLQIERMRAAGANDYLTKPLDVKRFLEVLNEQWRATQEKELSQ